MLLNRRSSSRDSRIVTSWFKAEGDSENDRGEKENGTTGCKNHGVMLLNLDVRPALLVASPDPGVERSADTKADADAEAEDEHNDEDLDNHAVPVAEARETVAARVLPLAGFCLGLPMIPAGPDLAVLVTTIPHKIC